MSAEFWPCFNDPLLVALVIGRNKSRVWSGYDLIGSLVGSFWDYVILEYFTKPKITPYFILTLLWQKS